VTLRIVRLGPRDPREGTRIGTVRRPPRGVPKERHSPDDWFDVWFPDLGRVVLRHPLLRSVLNRLPGRKLVFSNSPVHYSRAVLETLRVADLFDDVFSIEHTGFRPKPDPAGFIRLMRKHRLHPRRCIMVEDSLPNLRTAKRLGMKTVWVDPSSKAPAYVDVNIRDLPRLPAMLRHLHVG